MLAEVLFLCYCLDYVIQIPKTLITYEQYREIALKVIKHLRDIGEGMVRHLNEL